MLTLTGGTLTPKLLISTKICSRKHHPLELSHKFHSSSMHSAIALVIVTCAALVRSAPSALAGQASPSNLDCYSGYFGDKAFCTPCAPGLRVYEAFDPSSDRQCNMDWQCCAGFCCRPWDPWGPGFPKANAALSADDEQ